jgi:hypothetical protein
MFLLYSFFSFGMVDACIGSCMHGLCHEEFMDLWV